MEEPGTARVEVHPLPAKMIKELVHEISRDFHPDCAKEDDEIDDQEDRDVMLTEFFVKAYRICTARS